MKRFLGLFILAMFGLSACTFLFPAQVNASIVEVGFADSSQLAILLQDADQSYYITVNGEPYDCQPVADRPGFIRCTGPGFEPGEKVILRIYKDNEAIKALGELSFTVPEYDPEFVDSDGDGAVDADDQCPADPQKSLPGQCGCGAADTDTDGDGTADCVDDYPADPNQNGGNGENGENGGTGEEPQTSDQDQDEDGTPDSEDGCPEDPEKSEPGVCGCGVADLDEDQDGIIDCEDECPIAYSDLIGDPCDKDEDNDGVVDGADQCPFDPNKFTAGACGCGYPDYDTDGDGVADCIDGCPKDKNKTEPGKCGCGVKDKDSDGDGIVDCKDKCPGDINDPVGDPCDHDEDCDGFDDWIDECPYDELKKYPGICGCGEPDEDSDGDGLKDCEDDCPFEFSTEPNGCPL